MLDIATSERAFGHVTLAKLAGTEIPLDWATDQSGERTADPSQVHALRPFAAHKGFGLALGIELLAGVLTGTPVGTQGSLDNRGVFMLLFAHRLRAIGSSFATAAQDFLAEVLDSGDDEHPVTYPGQASAARWDQAMVSESVTLPSPVWDRV